MHNVLIVDDDKVILHDIKKLMDWELWGFSVIAEAENGLEAIKIIRSRKIDLVITDIYMPVMDGVELIRKCKDEFPEIEFIVISNYDEFKYVKEAMKLGAFDYLLKYELDSKSFLPIINLVKKKIREKENCNINPSFELDKRWRPVLEEKFWRNLIYDQMEGEELLREAGSLKIDLSTYPYIILLLEVSFPNIDESLELKELKKLDLNLLSYVKECSDNFKYAFTLKAEKNIWAVILKASEKSHGIIKNSAFFFSKALIKSIKSQTNPNVFVEIGDVIIKPEEFHRNFQKMTDCLESRFYYGLDTIIDISYFNNMKTGFEDKNMEILRENALKAVQNLDFSCAEKIVFSIIEEANLKRYSPSLLYEFFTVLIFSIKKLLNEKGITAFEEKPISIEKKLRSMKTLKTIETYIREALEEISKEIIDKNGNNYRFEIRKALSLINQNFSRNLTLEYIAEYAGVSKNYFCRLFKEETGENFVEYINRLRIEKAKQLIAESNKSMKEISSTVGLDYTYFCKVFKNSVGKRPSDLRE